MLVQSYFGMLLNNHHGGTREIINGSGHSTLEIITSLNINQIPLATLFTKILEHRTQLSPPLSNFFPILLCVSLRCRCEGADGERWQLPVYALMKCGQKQDSCDSVSFCTASFSCSLLFPLCRTEYLEVKKKKTHQFLFGLHWIFSPALMFHYRTL